MPNPPIRHHYVPEFYLRQWSGDDGRLERFSSTHEGAIDVRRVYPSQLGFQKNLYRLPGEHKDAWQAQALETDFFSHVDRIAAASLNMLLNDPAPSWDSESRSGWSRFILSLRHRSPDNMRSTLKTIRQIYDKSVPDIQRRYEELRSSADPVTYEEWERLRAPTAAEKATYRTFTSAIENEQIGTFINEMVWHVRDVSDSDHTLLIGDNPAILVPLKLPQGHIALALSPTKLFLATQHKASMENLLAQRSRDLVRRANRLIVERATLFVGAFDRKQAGFISKHFGSHPAPAYE
jgi:hypothetical protein